jgi:hypothetical protein
MSDVNVAFRPRRSAYPLSAVMCMRPSPRTEASRLSRIVRKKRPSALRMRAVRSIVNSGVLQQQGTSSTATARSPQPSSIISTRATTHTRTHAGPPATVTVTVPWCVCQLGQLAAGSWQLEHWYPVAQPCNFCCVFQMARGTRQKFHL